MSIDTEFTPSTEQLRAEYGLAVSRLWVMDNDPTGQTTRSAVDEFDRWLAKHDAEADRLRALIKDAPHSPQCATRWTFFDDVPCDCFKAQA